ncbi:MAG: ATP-binding cassette domain-containing protein [bacterium]
MPMIEFQEVTISFQDKCVLDQISFKVHFYEKVAILGGSGTGKTTLLKLIVGLILPDSGRILIDNQDITKSSEDELRKIRKKFSIVFQEGALFDSLNVMENVAFLLREYTNLSTKEIEKKVWELLKRLGIEETLYIIPDKLSGGMQRRVAIARSLVSHEPEIILYDEPTTGLDPITSDNICDLINELSKVNTPHKKGLIIVTHKVTDAAKVAERFMYLKANKIAFDGNLEALRKTDDKELQEFIKELKCITIGNNSPGQN